MKKYLILSLLIALTFTSCVQKSYNRKVELLLDVSALKNIKSVGIRGNEKPFSWDYDTEMEVVKKDSLYKKTFTINTGYLFTELKFTVNGDFELKDKDNRKIYFNQAGTTIYKAKFDVVK